MSAIAIACIQSQTRRIILDPRLKNLMKELGDTINQSLSDSEEIAEVITRIKHQGYDVFLVLEATIGFNRRDDQLDDSEVLASEGQPELHINAQDERFLRSLRISVDDSSDRNDHAA
jgi:hypothetical protein